jgi:protein-L-isoaspartate(D-aspartate) O-methyltransferase
MRRSSNQTYAKRRRALVAMLAAEGELSDLALCALNAVPRHRFVPPSQLAEAYENHPLPIGLGQTISQPFMVGWLLDAVGADKGRKILEVGTGCGYQAAVLAAAGAEVWSIEVRPALARRARQTLDAEGFAGVRTRLGDGGLGWPEEAPFDGVVLTAAPTKVPDALFGQVAEGGCLVAPIGPERGEQRLFRFTNLGGEQWKLECLGGVRFVPMVQGKRGKR